MINLPIIDEKYNFPSGKPHVSYSEIVCWITCPFKHKLKYIDHIELDKPTIHTEYGKIIHSCLEQYILTQSLITDEVILEVQNNFNEICGTLRNEHKVTVTVEDQQSFCNSIPALLKAVPVWFDTYFPGWEPVAAEYPIYEKIEGQDNKWFKGFIDAAIKIPKKSRKKNLLLEEKEYEYFILDFKTTSWGWKPDQKQDFNKQLQLILYKHYFCKILKLNLKDVKCGFLLLKRIPRKKDNEQVELVTISVGPKTEEKALSVLNNMVNQIQTKRVIKDRNGCQWCEYRNSKWCP